jgi:phenylpropionate dioxygenase-like ring-hydroxylating dioxygenase large terminal subunit
VQEVQGNIWVFFGNKTENLPPVPTVPDIGDKYQLHISQVFKCNVDHAVIGLMDPAHGPYVHKSPLWRSKRTSYEKEKAFSPIEMGWKMDRHAASKNSKAYRIFLGGMPETEISFQLPTVRIEHAKTPKYTYCGLTVCTPIDAETTEVHHCMYWDVPWLSRVKPLLKLISHQFLGQDRRAVEQQKEGLAYDPNLMLINDADMMAKWYFRLKKEYAASQAEQRAFKNPVKPAVLRWRS